MATIKARFDKEADSLNVLFTPASSAQITIEHDPTNDRIIMRIPGDMAQPMVKAMNRAAKDAGMDTAPTPLLVTTQMPTEPGDAGPG